MSKPPKKKPLTEEQIRESDALKAVYAAKSKALGVTQEKIATAMSRKNGEGVTQGAVSHFMNRRTPLNPDAASIFATMLDVPVSDFSPRLAKVIAAMGKGLTAGLAAEEEVVTHDEFELVDQLTARVEGGHGEENDHVEVRGGLAFKRSYIKRRGAKGDALRVVYGSGRSMEPIIQAGDAILVNTASRELKANHIYAFANSEYKAIIKRAVFEGGKWILRSENPDKSVKAHRDMYFFDDSGSPQFEVIGLALWRGGDL